MDKSYDPHPETERWAAVDRYRTANHDVVRYVFEPRHAKGLAEGVIRSIAIMAHEGEVVTRQICISSQLGCAVKCSFCNYGEKFYGQLSADEIFAQAAIIKAEDEISRESDFPVEFAFFGGGEPLHNFSAVAESIRRLHAWNPEARITLSTSCPKRNNRVYEQLNELGQEVSRLELQLSCHASDAEARREIIPTPTLTPAEIAALGERWLTVTGRRPELAFAALDHYGTAEWAETQAQALRACFEPDCWHLKITPVFPTGDTVAMDREAVDRAERLFRSAKLAGFSPPRFVKRKYPFSSTWVTIRPISSI